jgi:hypothetical protein
VEVDGAETKPAPITPLLAPGLKNDVTARRGSVHLSGSLVNEVADVENGELPVVSTRLRNAGLAAGALHAVFAIVNGSKPFAPLK